jgi:hypothetical protein
MSKVLKTKTAPAKTLADFRAEYDPDVRVPKLISAGLASLLALGTEAWEYELDFIRRCGPGVGNASLAAYRDKFAKHIVEVKQGNKNVKRVWFADIKVAAKARGG